ncbi:leucyl aminopeptidase [Candidatus Synechococcus spongiarum]|uniref:Probable cytosol aminopeptidase n=1 Tax=Candidatus Synechococcus spongiarum TaxID=431041 RepID=A0A164YVP5_9SYNE|nr:leucyl aminopeptidase [Candidatus Synechococcus spongiarum]SAY38481.1 Cytosol aminopeptidase PepA (EC 3.4.11.1) [Candidatus Synechococcus spongiarum]
MVELHLIAADAPLPEEAALAVGLFSDKLDAGVTELNTRLGLSLANLVSQRKFKANAGEALVFQLLSGAPQTVLLLGLGERSGHTLQGLQKAAVRAARAAQDQSVKTLVLDLPLAGLGPTAALQTQAMAVRLAMFKDLRFKGKARNGDKGSDRKDTTTLNDVRIVCPGAQAVALARAEAICSGVELARELVAAPPNVVTPLSLATTAQQLAEDHGLGLKILERADCERLGMGSYLGVAQASGFPPKFLHLTYRSQEPVKRCLVLVGKGLTFDSGGYNLKVGASQIEMMKYDMGGCGAVLGAARAIGQLKPKGVEVHFISATCENMVSGDGLRPGDIITASNGITIEVNNTDAEGRLTLADALIYACNLKPDAVVDLATLTGACLISLGDELAGLWSPDDELAADLLEAAQRSGEGLWRMPLPASYLERMKSPFADLKNTGPRFAGAITAALFLKEFVSQGVAWAHMDIAGTVWSDKGHGDNPAGATGYGVRTLVEWVSAHAAD